MVFDTREESAEKKIRELEKRIERLEQSIDMFRSFAAGMQRDNAGLKKDRDFLLRRYKEVIRSIHEPIKKEMEETAKLVHDIIVEELPTSSISGEAKPLRDSEKRSFSRIDDLFELVIKEKKVGVKAAARKLGVDVETVERWAEKLEKSGTISAKNGKLFANYG